MKTNLNHFATVLGILVLCFFIFSCEKKQNTSVSTVAPENPYVYSYTSGIISTQSEVQIIFASTQIPGAETGVELSEQIFTISPNVDGKAYWKNKNTLIFEPSNPFTAAENYEVSVNIGAIIKDAKPPYEIFTFKFRTREQHVGVKVEGLKIFENQAKNRISFLATILTEDRVSKADLSSCISAKIDGKLTEILWEDKLDSKTHTFSVAHIERTKKIQILEITIDGKNLNATEKIEIKQNIPQDGDFNLTQVRRINPSNDGIRIEFSDLLDPNQDLEGFFQIEAYNGALPYLIEQNVVRLFPDNNLYGNLKLILNPGLKSISGKIISKRITESFYINPSLPAVSLVSQGAIVPNSKGVYFPFNAIGLSAVDVEIYKVGSQNILSLLKDNDINETGYQMYRVGKIIKQKTITLNHINPLEDGLEWKKYFLDLNELIQTDPGAIYQVRIGFRQEYAIHPCGDQDPVEVEKGRSDLSYFKDEEGNQTSILDNFYGGIADYNEYNWDNRENPCFPEYYNSNKFVSGNLLVSNFGITAKRGNNNEIWVFISDLVTTEPLSNVNIEVYDDANELTASQKTDKNGIASLKLNGSKPAVIVSHKGKNKGYLRLREEDALNLSRFDISGEQIKADLRGFIYAERNIWRPGDSMYFNFMLQDKKASLPKEYPITMELFDAKGQLYERRVTNKNVNGIYPLFVSTQVNDQTGTWRMSVKAGETSFEKSFKIESIRPNRLKSSLLFNGKVLMRENEPFQASIKADWLHGIPAAGLKAIVELKLKGESNTFHSFPSFNFENEFFKNIKTENSIIYNGNLDETGRAALLVKISENPDLSGKMSAIFQTRVFEPSGEFSTTVERIPYHPFKSYVGFEIPKNTWGEPVLPENKSSIIRFAVVDKDGNPLRNKKINISLFKTDWFWWWDNDQYRNADFNTETAKQTIREVTLTTDSKGLANWNLTIKDWGRYLLLAEDLSSGHKAAQYIYSGYPDGATDSNEKNILSLMPVKTDKAKYIPGEKAILSFPGSSEGTALVTIESGSSILQTFRIKTKKGNNTISLPISEEMSPNVYAYISFIQSYESVKNDLPIRLFGICPIYVENPATILKPQIYTKESFKPGEKISIAIAEEKGKEMTYTLSVVDEGLLGITRFKTPNPHLSFYSKIGLGVRTWDIYNKVLGAFGADLGNLLAIGGDDSYQPEVLNNTGTQYSSVVFQLGPFHLKKGQKLNHNITLPNYMGAVRIMVVAKNMNSYGSAEKLVAVKSPVMLFASAPRTLSPGDQFLLPVNIFSTQNNLKKVVVTSFDESGILTSKTNSFTINMQDKKENLVEIPFSVSGKTGLTKLKIKITSSIGTASQILQIPVRNPNPISYRVINKVLNPGETWIQNIPDFGQKGTQEVILETSTVPNLGLNKRLSYLLNYPYGCLEQTVSSAFAQLYMDKWVDLNQNQQKLRVKHIQSAIQQINRFQLSSGGFSYWPGNYQFDEWVTSYTGQFLLEAKLAGFLVPSNMLKKWEKFQIKLVKGLNLNTAWASAESPQINQAYRLYTLALAGKPEKGAMNQLRELKNLYNSAANRLAGAYALTGNVATGNKILAGKSKNLTKSGYTTSYGSDMRDRAQLLETYIQLGNTNKSGALASQLTKEFSKNQWYSTHTTAYVLLALSKYLGNQRAGEPARFRFISPASNGKWVEVLHEKSVGFTQFKDFTGIQKLQIQNLGKSKLFLQFIQAGKEPLGEVKAVASGIELKTEFFTLNGQKLDPAKISQGEDFKAEITVKHTGENPFTYTDLGLTQVFPSGWEIINERMTNFNAEQQQDYDFLDVKDDRSSYFFTLGERQVKKFTVRLNATFSGRFYYPAASVSDMYNYQINAQTNGNWINISKSMNN